MFALTIIAVAAFASIAEAAEIQIVPADVVRIIDGDTFLADAHPWPDVTIRARVRVLGVDTPEIRGKCAKEKRLALEARDAVRAWLGNWVTLYVEGKDSFGRTLARVKLSDGRDLAEALISAGLGRVYREGSEDWCE